MDNDALGWQPILVLRRHTLDLPASIQSVKHHPNIIEHSGVRCVALYLVLGIAHTIHFGLVNQGFGRICFKQRFVHTYKNEKKDFLQMLKVSLLVYLNRRSVVS